MDAHLQPFRDPLDENLPLVIVGGDGCFVIDDRGKRYLDAAAALWCTSLGFSNERLIAAAERQYRSLPYYHSMMGRTSGPSEELARVLTARLPGDLNHVFFGSSGSEAVDTAIKLAHFYQNGRGNKTKKAIIARDGAYHGSGFLSAAATGFAYCHDGFDVPVGQVLRVTRPHFARFGEAGESERQFSERLAGEIDELIRTTGADNVCAMIGEPALGSGGSIPAPDGYWAAVQDVLRSHDVLLIADEIITGFGRTGQWFGSETYGIEPDLMTMAKQLTGSYFPMSAVAVSDRIVGDMNDYAHDLGTLGHGFTYSGHPVGSAIALEAIAMYEEMDLPGHVGERAEWLAERLEPVAARAEVFEVRQVGLMVGVEVHPVAAGDAIGEAGEAVKNAGLDRGVIFRNISDTLAMSPPLIIDRDEIDFMVTTLEESLDHVFGAGS
ncbi:MAG: aminotransferase class III-fold pyridoxal phosphate-dependent enzyme [Actinomycetota bacterium]